MPNRESDATRRPCSFCAAASLRGNRSTLSTSGEYNRVVDLTARARRPSGRSSGGTSTISTGVRGRRPDAQGSLLDRRMALGLATERWTNGGLWVISRHDTGYPERLRMHLSRSAPPLLWGVGDGAIAESGGVAIVGSRDIDEGGSQWCAEVASACARERLTVISGGARGVDQIAMRAALDAGGRVTAVLPEGLGKPSVVSRYREAVVDGRLLLLSPFYPDAGFTIGSAMGRNKVMYGLAEAAVIVRADAQSGGTWAGAEEELKRGRACPSSSDPSRCQKAIAHWSHSARGRFRRDGPARDVPRTLQDAIAPSLLQADVVVDRAPADRVTTTDKARPEKAKQGSLSDRRGRTDGDSAKELSRDNHSATDENRGVAPALTAGRGPDSSQCV